MPRPTRVACGHLFCQRCLNLCLRQIVRKCPLCRARAPPDEFDAIAREEYPYHINARRSCAWALRQAAAEGLVLERSGSGYKGVLHHDSSGYVREANGRFARRGD